jgi:hypothetical protein
MKEFKGTRGEVKDVTIELADWSVCNVGTNSKTICSMFYEGVKVPDETLLNQKLIIDAFKVRQSINCELSELLEAMEDVLNPKYQFEECAVSGHLIPYNRIIKFNQLIKKVKDNE